MGQYWKFINLDKQQASGNWGKLGEFANCVPDVVIYDLLHPYFEVLPFPPNKALTFAIDTTPRSLSNLPVEVHDLIFEQITNSGDCLCLAVASSSFWEVGRKRLKTLMLKEQPSWAGDRIMCIGDYCTPGDNPKNVLTEAEIRTLKDKEGDEVSGQDADAGNEYTQSLYDWAYGFSGRTGSSIRSVLMSYGFDRLSPREYRLVRQLTSTSGSTPINTREMILRNLTEHSYVRGKALKPLGLDFGEVVITHICWSSDPSCSMPNDGDGITRGIWAGHRFDIVTPDMVDMKDGASAKIEWRDVSEEVVEKLRKVFEM